MALVPFLKVASALGHWYSVVWLCGECSPACKPMHLCIKQAKFKLHGFTLVLKH